jgi:bla regulator protein blaR1
MENLFLYLLKVSGLIAVFFMAYYFLLRKETFFTSNRWFLLLGLVTSISLPLVTFKKVVMVESAPMPENWEAMAPMAFVDQPKGFEINWFLVAASVYLIGIFIFFFKFVFDFSGLMKALKGKTVTQQAAFKYIDVAEKVSPFSYFNYIVYNSSMYTQTELDNILEHEKVHCEQHHSIDVLISRVFCIVFWYNPFVWLYQKAILQNLEFIADSGALKNIADKKAYQITLLKVTTHDNCVAITNHFFQSLIKKRIIMLNKNQSKKSRSWKYALIIPALAAFLFYFQVKVIAQEKNNTALITKVADGGSVTVVINKNTTDAEMKKDAEMLKAQHGIKLKFSKIKRNSAGEIVAIKVTYKDKDNKAGTYHVNGDEPIKPLRFFKNDNGGIGFGNSRDVRVVRHGGDNDSDDDNIEVIVVRDPGDVTEPLEPLDPLGPPAPAAPEDVERVVVKKFKNKDGKIMVSVNGEVIDLDVDRIIADATADMDFNFDFDFDSEDMDDATREEMKKVKIEMEKIRPQMEKARIQMEHMRPRMREQAKRDAAQARLDVEQAKRDIEQAERDIEQSKRDIEEAKREIEQSKRDVEREKAELKKSKKSK